MSTIFTVKSNSSSLLSPSVRTRLSNTMEFCPSNMSKVPVASDTTSPDCLPLKIASTCPSSSALTAVNSTMTENAFASSIRLLLDSVTTLPLAVTLSIDTSKPEKLPEAP